MYSVMGIVSVVGVVVCLVIVTQGFLNLNYYNFLVLTHLFFQGMVVAFSLGVGPIPWIIMSEVAIFSIPRNFIFCF